MLVLKAIGILSAVALLVLFILLVWAGFDDK
jgi:hypothetical protein